MAKRRDGRAGSRIGLEPLRGTPALVASFNVCGLYPCGRSCSNVAVDNEGLSRALPRASPFLSSRTSWFA